MHPPFVLALALVLAACAEPSSPLPLVPPADVVSVDVSAIADVSDASPDIAALDAASDVAAPTPLRVLFVGNSYTYVNDLPAMMVRMGAAAARAGSGPDIIADSVTVGGATLRNHWETGTAPSRITAGGWDAVVLQGQSVEPVLNNAEFRSYGERFGMLAGAHGARAVFYATWPRRAGDAVYAQTWSGGTQEVFNTRMRAAYAQVATTVDGTLAPVGDAWLNALRQRPELNLYDPDGSHPSAAGSWLAACVLYRALTSVAASAETEAAVPSVPAADARFLRELSAAP